MNIEQIAKRPWLDREAREQMSFRVGEALVGVRVPIPTGGLLVKLGVDMADARGVRNCLDHLYNARKDGMLDGYFTIGRPVPGTFGKPSVKWHDAKA